MSKRLLLLATLSNKSPLRISKYPVLRWSRSKVDFLNIWSFCMLRLVGFPQSLLYRNILLSVLPFLYKKVETPDEPFSGLSATLTFDETIMGYD